MTPPDQDDPSDDLLQRYREASAQDTRRPASKVHEAVRSHAQMVMASNTGKPEVTQAPAANQSRWKISLLASVALASLTGLLVLQFDRGTPEEKEVAYGRPGALVVPPASPSPSPSSPPKISVPAPAPSPAAGEAKALASPPVVNPKPSVNPSDRPRPSSNKLDSQVATTGKTSPQAGLATPSQSVAESSPPAPSPAVASQAAPPPASGKVADANAAAPGTAGARESGPASAAAPPSVQRAAPTAPAARATAPLQQNDAAALQAPPSRAEDAGRPRDLTAALHEAARTGRLPQLERLLQQGAPLNAPDDAGRTALMLAVIHNHTAMVQRLLALGANAALLDREGLNALQHARRLGLDRIAALIEAGS